MIKTALITGASGGLGLEFARLFAARKCNLVLVARSREKLEKIKQELEQEYLIHVLTIVQDLTENDAAETVYHKLSVLGISVDYLINNAGFGDNHAFHDSEWNRQEQMIRLNILSLMQLCYLFGGDMKKRRKGRILNVASITAYSAGPYMSVYFASKAFVLSFSEALSEELRPFGVTVTALCPGLIATGFESASQMENCRMLKLLKAVPADKIAKDGFRAMMKGRVSAVSGSMAKPFVFLSHVVPRSVSRKFTKYMTKPDP